MNFSTERHCQELESLGSVFMPIVKGVLSAEDFIQTDIVLNWVDIIGEEISSYTTPIKVKLDIKTSLKTLYIEVPVGGYALEIKHREQYILDKINAYFGYNTIHKIAVNQNMNLRCKIKLPSQPQQKKNNFTEDEKKYLEEISCDVKDEKLKEILIKLVENVILSNKEKKKINENS
jgi:hypothetical protein